MVQNMGQNDCRLLLEATEQMTEALQSEDMEALGSALDKRQELLERLSAAGASITPEGKKLLARALQLDKQATNSAQALLSCYQKEMSRFQVRYKDLLRYEKNRFNVSQGQLIDTKR